MKLPHCQCSLPMSSFDGATHFVMRSSMDRGSRMKVGSVTRLRSAPGRSCEMMWESTEEAALANSSCVFQSPHMPGRRTVALVGIHDRFVFFGGLVARIMSP
jgi:hypothetical protein